jgi:[ribosomal protein S5]-alanine N-acetyltransferase
LDNRVMAKTEKAAAMGVARAYLAPLSPSYAPGLFELLNDWDVVRMLSEVPWPLRYEDVETFLSSEHPNTDDFVILANLDVKRRNEFGGEIFRAIGVCGVKRPGSSEPPRKMPRLGYWIGRPHWGQGFGTEAVAELVDRAFRMYPHDRVGAGVFKENAASQRVLAKLGFTAKGSKMVTSRSRGGEVEAIDMQVTRAEWEAAKARRQ